ncbi:potassium channel family protein [Streptomyces meridianus]|uniref:Potassium channel family protein n=1 Tax=Streptomyces meridianus TaxID=2938945 RepID=A0ABT0XA73_9ACTN|nr:potassium channel family protein [Streptomyces meridianus]MCM2579430.1 potassium channel family protein [Streptomyces meridianus]
MRGDSAIAEWERYCQVPLLVASLLYLAAYTVHVLVPEVSPGWHEFWLTITFGTWAAFIIDYAVRLGLSPSRWVYARKHWLDLLVVLLPLLRPLRMVQVYAAAQLRRPHPRLSLEGQVMALTLLTALLLGYSGSLAVYRVEQGAPGASILTFGDAVWWACVTLSTTGYGDVVPVTWRGRVLAVLMMAVGVALIGAVVGVFSSWLVQSFREKTQEARRRSED